MDDGSRRPVMRDHGPFLVILIAVSIVFAWILLPFLAAILWAVIAAILFTPVHDRLLAKMPARRSSAALLTLLLIVALVIVPAAILTVALVGEATAIYGRIQAGDIDPARIVETFRAAMPLWLSEFLNNLGLSNMDKVRSMFDAGAADGIRAVLGQALEIGQGLFSLLLKLSVMLYLAFFLIRDGDSLKARVAAAVPLRSDHLQRLVERFTVVVRATIKGTIIVAILQGMIGGIILWALGIEAPLLWGVLMGAASLIPAVGTGLVWVPMALYLFFTGSVWQGAVLVFCGFVVIGMVDNVVRPILVGRETRIPDYAVLITTLGGLQLFGFHGIVIGPVVAAMFIAVWDIATDMRAEASPAA